jgi:Nif-specific regulatory protein
MKNLELQVLSAICGIIDRALSLDEALSETLGILSGTMRMKRATITLLDRDTGRLSIRAAHGLSAEETRRGVYSPSEGVTGRIFRTACPSIVQDVRRDPLFLDRTASRKAESGRVSFIGTPILSRGRPIGVLGVDRISVSGEALEEDARLLGVVATLIAQFISLNDQVKERVAGLKLENVWLKSRLALGMNGPYIVGASQAMADVQRRIEKVAVTKATVLLLGESGTGKTLMARTIHELSDRKGLPFVKVNCAAIPDTLIEAELFGRERGAYTGASVARPGRFEDAGGGTIFLDEIGELPLGVQSKFLRALQEREFERLGGNATKKVDARILTATNKDLERLVEAGQFREDLYYRLNVFPIKVPPLRERPEDVPKLLAHFLSKASKDYGRELAFAPAALALLTAHAWPGNAREMENLIERMAIMADGEVIDAAHVRASMDDDPRDTDLATYARPCAACSNGIEERSPDCPHSRLARAARSLEQAEREEVEAALARAGGNRNKAARELGLTPRQMGYRVKKFELEVFIAREKMKKRTAVKG